MESYIVAAIGDWNRELFDQHSKEMLGDWYFVSNPEELDKTLLNVKPRYIFFSHWRWIVPENIIENYECICFHMTDVPYGRGGSPLQNLIIRGHKDTILTALRMEKGLDTGPVYMKVPLSLDGTAQEIYYRSSKLIWNLIHRFINENPTSTPQVGDPVIFKRRKPEESRLPDNLGLEGTYDFIRMLDADGYPNAFIEQGNFLIKFTNAKIMNDKLVATAEFHLKDNH